MKQQSKAPVSKNQELELVIEGWGSQGEGIGRYCQFAIFVPGALPGETVRIRIVKVEKHLAYGKVLQVLIPSANRASEEEAGACPLYGRCGGCQLSHMRYEAQLAFKRDKVKQALVRIGSMSPDQVEAVLAPQTHGMPQGDWHYYRNKAQFPLQMVEGRPRVGFYAPRSHRLLPVTDCLLQSKAAARVIQAIEAFLEQHAIPIYQEETHKGVLRHVLIRDGRATGEISVCLVINSAALPQKDAWIALMKQLGVDSFSININRQRGNVILGSQTEVIWGRSTITDRLGGVQFHIAPAAFYQVNPVQTERLYQKALAMAQLSGDEVVWDAYCGIGTISLFLAQKAKQVYGVEIVPDAIENARENARLNQMDNVCFYVGEAETVIPRLYHEEGIKADVMVLDPPRSGCEERLLRTLLDMAPGRIVYVSCDPATLARDCKRLCESQYRVEKVETFDLFPNTYHVETVVLLQRETL